MVPSRGLLKIGFGYSEMTYLYHHRAARAKQLGGNHRPRRGTVAQARLTADEHHADWAGQKGYVATTVGGGCILGVALTASADDVHLQEAYGVFAAEARDVDPMYAPQTVNTDGWAATQNAFQKLFPRIAVVLCFLHGFLKIRDRCRKAHDLHRRVWEVYVPTVEFLCVMNDLAAVVHNGNLDCLGFTELLTIKWGKKLFTGGLRRAGMPSHEHRVPRPMNRLCGQFYARRRLHGHEPCAFDFAGLGRLIQIRPYAPRSNQGQTHEIPAHRLYGMQP